MPRRHVQNRVLEWVQRRRLQFPGRGSPQKRHGVRPMVMVAVVAFGLTSGMATLPSTAGAVAVSVTAATDPPTPHGPALTKPVWPTRKPVGKFVRGRGQTPNQRSAKPSQEGLAPGVRRLLADQESGRISNLGFAQIALGKVPVGVFPVPARYRDKYLATADVVALLGRATLLAPDLGTKQVAALRAKVKQSRATASPRQASLRALSLTAEPIHTCSLLTEGVPYNCTVSGAHFEVHYANPTNASRMAAATGSLTTSTGH